MPYDDHDGRAADLGQTSSSPKAADDEERVGYKQPPKHSQFRKGQSGNPAGRPKGSLNKSTVRALVAAQWLEERIKIVEGGRERRVPRLVALLKKQAEIALKGDPKVMKDVLNYIERLAVEAPALKTSEETATEDEAILRNHWPAALDSDEHDANPRD